MSPRLLLQIERARYSLAPPVTTTALGCELSHQYAWRAKILSTIGSKNDNGNDSYVSSNDA